jgi:hypothetical protein
MASGHVNRIERPNTWLHRPMLQNVKKHLPTRSRPHMARNGPPAMSAVWSLSGGKRTCGGRPISAAIDPKRTCVGERANDLHPRPNDKETADMGDFRRSNYRNRFACGGLVYMQTFETTDPKVARRCRYDQHRGQKTTVTVEGSLVTAFVHSVMEDRFSNPTRWVVTVIAKPSIAA